MSKRPSHPTPNSDGRIAVKPKRAAHMIDRSESTLARMRCLGTGPAYSKKNGSIYYLVTDLHKWLADNVCQSTSEYSEE